MSDYDPLLGDEPQRPTGCLGVFALVVTAWLLTVLIFWGMLRIIRMAMG